MWKGWQGERDACRGVLTTTYRSLGGAGNDGSTNWGVDQLADWTTLAEGGLARLTERTRDRSRRTTMTSPRARPMRRSDPTNFLYDIPPLRDRIRDHRNRQRKHIDLRCIAAVPGHRCRQCLQKMSPDIRGIVHGIFIIPHRVFKLNHLHRSRRRQPLEGSTGLGVLELISCCHAISPSCCPWYLQHDSHPPHRFQKSDQ